MATEPENRCSICLDSWEEAGYVVPCLHQFCYPCILQWAESKPECPLCRGRVSSILHSVQADDDFREHAITPAAAHGSAEGAPGHPAVHELYSPEAAWPAGPRPLPVDPVGGFHVYTWAFIFRRYPTVLHPLLPWLHQELVQIIENAALVQGFILASLRYFGLHEEALIRVLQGALGRHTRRFVRCLTDTVVLLCRSEARRRVGLGGADAAEEREGSLSASRGRVSAPSSDLPGGPSSTPSDPGPTNREREEPEEDPEEAVRSRSSHRHSCQLAGRARRRRTSSPDNPSRPHKRPHHRQ